MTIHIQFCFDNQNMKHFYNIFIPRLFFPLCFLCSYLPTCKNYFLNANQKERILIDEVTFLNILRDPCGLWALGSPSVRHTRHLLYHAYLILILGKPQKNNVIFLVARPLRPYPPPLELSGHK